MSHTIRENHVLNIIGAGIVTLNRVRMEGIEDFLAVINSLVQLVSINSTILCFFFLIP